MRYYEITHDIGIIMKAHYLTPLFSPQSVAVIGASETPGSSGDLVFRNLLAHGYQGQLFAVNPRHNQVHGKPSAATVEDLDCPIDLAVITTPARTLPGIIKQCGRHGVKGALILSRDLVALDEDSRKMLSELTALASRYQLRILGPNMLGMMRPSLGLIAANYLGEVKTGNLAVIAQSSSIASAILDWGEGHGIGFSNVISLGAAVDVDFGEVLDYLVNDPNTRSILLYIEDVHNARGFMSALRAAARTKPVVALKVGRYDHGGEKLGRTHSERLIGRNDAFEAALRRAGVLQVRSMAQLFSAAKMLAANYRAQGRRLAVISNGYSAGLMAVDRALEIRVQLPTLSAGTVRRFDHELPSIGSHDNPVDILGDAPPERFVTAVEACLNDPVVDGVLLVFTPQAGTDDMATAAALIDLQRKHSKPLLLAWMGEKKVAKSRRLLSEHKMAYFHSPEHAVEVFYSLSAYSHIQRLSLQTPEPLGAWEAPDIDSARSLIQAALSAGRRVLSEVESKAILAAFHIPTTPTLSAADATDAVTAASVLGLPVAIKLDIDSLLHKTDIDGVELNVSSLDAVAQATQRLLARAREHFSNKLIRGVTVQPMHGKRHGRELLVGVTHDKVFGPLITFGSGGVNVEVVHDTAVALPPLNDFLAETLIRRTRVKRMLDTFRNQPAVDQTALRAALQRVSEMVCELPWIEELDINPLISDADGVIAVDARIVLRPLPAHFRRYSHMAIHPYPGNLVKHRQLRDGTPYLIRPIRPEDADMQQEFVRAMSEESRYNRYMSAINQLSQSMLVRFTQLDYAREMALLATIQVEQHEAMMAVARYTVNADFDSCEFALEVGDDWQGHGLGRELMEALFDAARMQGLSVMEGEVLANNSAMLGLMKKVGFDIQPHPEDNTLKWVTRRL